MARNRLSYPDRVDACQGLWVYLGKNVRMRERLAKRLGAPMALNGRLDRVSRELKQPFLDWIWAMARGREDDPAWWGRTLSWKTSAASDLFLLVSYHKLACDLFSEHHGLTIVVEDPWLAHDLAQTLATDASVEIEPLPPIRPREIGLTLLGILKRLRWLGRMLLSRVKLGAARSTAPQTGVLLFTHLLPHTLGPGRSWRDAYLGDLDKEIQKAGRGASRITYPDITGFESELTERAASTHYLLNEMRPGLLLDAFAHLPTPPSHRPLLQGKPFDYLLRREMRYEFSRASQCAYALFYGTLRRLLGKGSWDAIVFPWENQPQDRMICMAAREHGLRAVGYQHSTVPGLWLPYFFGRGEVENSPIPDVVLCTGEHPLRLIELGGFPKARLRLGGSRRYETGSKPWTAAPRDKGTVAVLLALEDDHNDELLAALTRSAAGRAGLRPVVKLHPADENPYSFMPPITKADGTLDELLDRCEGAVFTASTAGFDAMRVGIPVLRFRPETLLFLDPTDFIDDSELPTADGGTLAQSLAGLGARKPLPKERVEELERSLFAPLDTAAWQEAIFPEEALCAS